MKVEYKSDFLVTDAACKEATGRTLKDWYKALDARGTNLQRRDTVQWLSGEMDKDIWWSTTVWVEYERSKGVVNKKDGLIEGYNICVTKSIAASVADVYSAFSKPDELAKWFGKGVKASVVDGGSFEDKDGNSGEYLRVRPNKDLRFTWKGIGSDSATQVDVAFADKGKGKTGITLTHNRIQTRAEADGLRAAWGDAFDRLKAQLEGE
jgi:uncharacterized protein YndB with AHSA1/START domain